MAGAPFVALRQCRAHSEPWAFGFIACGSTHDAKEPLQYIVENTAGTRLGVLSDLGSLTPHVISSYQDCHALQLEANHDPVLLQNGPYPPSLRQRVASDYGHLSNQQCAALLGQCNGMA